MDVEAIARGLAANLCVLKPDWQVSLFLLDSPTPGAIQVGTITEVEYQTFGTDSAIMTWSVEACLQHHQDVSLWTKLRQLQDGGVYDIKAAIEADTQLQSRMADDGAITISQEPACDDLEAVFAGLQPRVSLEAGVIVALATWNVRVLT